MAKPPDFQEQMKLIIDDLNSSPVVLKPVKSRNTPRVSLVSSSRDDLHVTSNGKRPSRSALAVPKTAKRRTSTGGMSTSAFSSHQLDALQAQTSKALEIIHKTTENFDQLVKPTADPSPLPYRKKFGEPVKAQSPPPPPLPRTPPPLPRTPPPRSRRRQPDTDSSTEKVSLPTEKGSLPTEKASLLTPSRHDDETASNVSKQSRRSYMSRRLAQLRPGPGNTGSSSSRRYSSPFDDMAPRSKPVKNSTAGDHIAEAKTKRTQSDGSQRNKFGHGNLLSKYRNFKQVEESSKVRDNDSMQERSSKEPSTCSSKTRYADESTDRDSPRNISPTYRTEMDVKLAATTSTSSNTGSGKNKGPKDHFAAATPASNNMSKSSPKITETKVKVDDSAPKPQRVQLPLAIIEAKVLTIGENVVVKSTDHPSESWVDASSTLSDMSEDGQLDVDKSPETLTRSRNARSAATSERLRFFEDLPSGSPADELIRREVLHLRKENELLRNQIKEAVDWEVQVMKAYTTLVGQYHTTRNLLEKVHVDIQRGEFIVGEN